MTEINWNLVDNACCEKFESAWLEGSPVSIESCLPESTTPAFLPTLEELVHIEMEFTWRGLDNGEADVTLQDSSATVETYIQRFQDLESDEIILRLVEQEMRCRKRALGEVKFEEFSSRFPSLTAGINNLKTFIEGEGKAGAVKNLDVGEQVGRYFITDRQGEGGFGLVWRADDPKLGRTIAIKQLSGRFARDAEQRLRFINEARIAAKLEHPGVVPVYDVEQSEVEHPYYTMKLVHGKTLEEGVQEFHSEKKNTAEEKVETLRLLNAFASICKAMQYSHDKGVIHRDLKPQNVILGDYGETIILDWGLAKFVHEEEPTQSAGGLTLGSIQVTAPGAVMGTPAYMSPEQARGDVESVDLRSDVYSLGVILFQILTGRLPFKGQTGDEMIANVLKGNPIQPRRLDAAIPRALEAICLRAMSFEANSRFQSVKELSSELDRFLADEPINSYQETLLEKTSRWARKHRTWVMVAAASLLVLTIGSIVASLLINEQRKIAQVNEVKAREAERLESIAKDDAIKAREKETEAKQEAVAAAASEKKAREKEQQQRELVQWQLSRLYIKDGLRNLDDADYNTAALWFAKSLKLNRGTQDESNDRIRLGATLRRQSRLADMYFCDEKKYGSILDVRFSDDEKNALILCQKRFESRNLETGAVLEEIDLGSPSIVRYSENAKFAVATTISVENLKNPTLSVVDLSDGSRVECRLNPEDDKVNYSVSKPRVSSQGDRVVACIAKRFGTLEEENFLAIWNIKEPENPLLTEYRKRGFASCEFSSDESWIVTGGKDHVACVWNAETAERLKELKHSDFYPREGTDYRQISDANFSTDGKYLVAASSDNVAYVWDLEKDEMIHQLDHGPNRNFSSVDRVEISREGELVATSDITASTRIWNYKTGQLLGQYDDFRGSITDVSLSANGVVVTASKDGYCKIWDARAGLLTPSLRHSNILVAATANSTHSRFLTACADQTVRYWDGETPQNGAAYRKIPHQSKSLYDKFELSSDGKYLVTSSRLLNEAKVQIWNASLLEQIGDDIDLPNIVGKFEFSRDNDKLLLTSTTGLKTEAPHFALVVDLTLGTEIGKRLEHDAEIVSAGFFADGNKVFTASTDKRAIVWNVSDSSELVSFDHDDAIRTACLGDADRVLVTGCRDKTVHFWSVESGERRFGMLTHDWPIKNLVASPDSKRLLVHGYWSDEAASVWLVDFATGKRVGDPIGHTNYRPPSFRHDSKYFSSLGKSRISIHAASDGKWISSIEHENPILGFAWHPKKDLFASASADKTLRIWDLHSGEPTAPRIKCVGVPVDPDFSSDGSVLIAGLAFGTIVKVWNSETGEPLTPDLGHPGLAEPVAYSTTHNEIYVGGYQLTVWNLDPFKETGAKAESLVELLSGYRIDKIGGLIPLTFEEQRARYKEHYSKPDEQGK